MKSDVSHTFHLTPDYLRAEVIGIYETEITIDPPTATVIASVVLPRLIMEITGLRFAMMVAEVTSEEVLPLVRLRCLLTPEYCTTGYRRAECPIKMTHIF
jgi:hypothetical protein